MSQLQIEVIGRDEFWKKAVLVEWEHRHPDLNSLPVMRVRI